MFLGAMFTRVEDMQEKRTKSSMDNSHSLLSFCVNMRYLLPYPLLFMSYD